MRKIKQIKVIKQSKNPRLILHMNKQPQPQQTMRTMKISDNKFSYLLNSFHLKKQWVNE